MPAQLCIVSHIEQVNGSEKCFLLSKECSFAILFQLIHVSWKKSHQKFYIKQSIPSVPCERTMYRIAEAYQISGSVLQKMKYETLYFLWIMDSLH
jgi:hypothetical protein